MKNEPIDFNRITGPGSPADVSARLERLPLAWPILRLIMIVAVGCFFENYFLQMTAYIAPGMVKSGVYVTKGDGFFDPRTVGFFILSGFAGMFVGSWLFGLFADRFGRRPIFVGAMLWYSGTTAVMAFQQFATAIDAWRFLSSIGLGLELVVVNSYVTELVSSRVRGRAVAIYQVTALSAVPLTAFVAYRLTPLTLFGMDGWRSVLLLGSLGVFLLFWLRRSLPESPRWLAAQGRAAEADAVVSRLEHACGPLPLAVSLPVRVNEPREGRLGDLFRAPYGKRTVMFVIQQLCMPIAFYGFAAWIPTLLIAKGIGVVHSLFYAFVIAFAQPLSPLIMLAFADRIDRKWQIAGGAAASALMTVGFALQSSPIAVVAFGLAIAFCNTVVTTSIAAYMPESFPTRLRVRGHGLVYGVSRVMAASSGPLIGWMLGEHGVIGVATLIGVSFAMVCTVTLALGPRVRGRTLEEINP